MVLYINWLDYEPDKFGVGGSSPPKTTKINIWSGMPTGETAKLISSRLGVRIPPRLHQIWALRITGKYISLIRI